MKRKELNLAIILVLFLLLSNIYSYIQYKEISEVQSFLYELKKDSDIKIGQLEALKECRANEILLNGNEISRDWEITNLGWRKPIFKARKQKTFLTGSDLWYTIVRTERR